MYNGIRWPTADDANRYNHAKKEYARAEAERLEAVERRLVAWEERNQHVNTAFKLKIIVDQRRDEADDKLDLVDRITWKAGKHRESVHKLRDRVDGARAKYKKMLASLPQGVPDVEQHAFLSTSSREPSAGEGSNRKRSGARDGNTASSKAVKVGGASAGKGARSGQDGDDAPSGVVGEDAANTETEEALRKKLADAHQVLVELEERLAEHDVATAKYGARIAREGSYAEKLERLADESIDAWEEMKNSASYQRAMENFNFHNLQLSKMKATAAYALRTLEEAKGMFIEAASLPGGHHVDDAVKEAMADIQTDRRKQIDAFATARRQPPPVLPHLVGLAAFSPRMYAQTYL